MMIMKKKRSWEGRMKVERKKTRMKRKRKRKKVVTMKK
jgi:hypothetical protein